MKILAFLIICLGIGIAIGYFFWQNPSKSTEDISLKKNSSQLENEDSNLMHILLDNANLSWATLSDNQIEVLVKDEVHTRKLFENGFADPQKNIFCGNDEQSKFIQNLYSALYVKNSLDDIPKDIKIVPRDVFIDYISNKETSNQYVALLIKNEETVKNAILNQNFSQIATIMDQMLIAAGKKPNKREDYRIMDIIIMMVSKKYSFDAETTKKSLNGCWNFDTSSMDMTKFKTSLLRK